MVAKRFASSLVRLKGGHDERSPRPSSAANDEDTASSNAPSSSRVETLIDPASFPAHPGANWSFRVDGAVR